MNLLNNISFFFLILTLIYLKQVVETLKICPYIDEKKIRYYFLLCSAIIIYCTCIFLSSTYLVGSGNVAMNTVHGIAGSMAFLSWVLYLRLITSYFKVSNFLTNASVIVSLAISLLFLADLVTNLFGISNILFKQSNSFQNSFMTLVGQVKSPTLLGKLSFLTSLTLSSLASVFLLIKLRRHWKEEKLIYFGLIIGLIITINDCTVGGDFVRWTIPLLPLAYILEIIRFNRYFGNKVDRKFITIRDELNRVGKLADVGANVSLITHDIKNPLAIIESSTELLAENNNNKDLCLLIQKNINQIKEIIRTYLRFIANDRKKIEPINFENLLAECRSFCTWRAKSYDVERMEIHCTNPDKQFYGSHSELLLVFTNLFYNSFDAIKDLPERWIKITTETVGETFHIHFCDSGKGIQKSISDRIFDQQFTTKQSSGNTGLGLYLVKEVVEYHNGSIQAGTNGGHTCFHIKLPLP